MPPKPKKSLVVLDSSPPQRAEYAVKLFAPIVAKMGLPWTATARAMDDATPAEMEAATRIVCVCPSEFRPLVESQFPTVTERIEYWPATMEIDDRVNILAAELMGGGFREISPPPPPPPAAAKKLGTAKVGRETAGRKGKGVTVVWELGLTAAAMQELATSLKQKCGTGGTVKDDRIEIQGDHRDRIVAELEKMGYKVKRAGG
ncbi:translation initiation factor [Limnoglobus roseus]|uniref:SUI1 domain-containing protein n=1 Tax=Limnoglobus roseus TaxID=2598579 RepID=A0A5C1AER6_9BACT|nr:hypothetical protein [Limnoglobus roseus]QEL17260.1 hypothetical protein PX52LOC_04243 [Limnoglobus roseus]